MNRKGFSLVELMATVVIIGILSTSGIMAVTSAIRNSRIKAYRNYEKQMVGAAKNYLSRHTEMIYEDYYNDDPTSSYVTVKVDNISVETLIAEGFLKDLKDPSANVSCDAVTSHVVVDPVRRRKNNNSQANYGFNYRACLCCVNSSDVRYDSFKYYYSELRTAAARKKFKPTSEACQEACYP